MNENFDAFDKYAQKYDLTIKMNEYKYNHSYRVVHQAEEICRSLNLDTYERDIASLIALLHDIARFRQWTDYETFNDKDSFDHGSEAVKILFDEGEINNYIVDSKEYNLIKKAIDTHNKFEIPSNYNEREKLHCKIVRDADKLDILYAFSTNRLLDLNDDESEISESISESFFNHKQEVLKEIHSKNDKLISMIGLVYDINFDYSAKRILNEEYLDKIYDGVKCKKIFKPYIEEAKKYLKDKKFDK